MSKDKDADGANFGGLSLTTLTKVAAFQKSSRILIGMVTF